MSKLKEWGLLAGVGACALALGMAWQMGGLNFKRAASSSAVPNSSAQTGAVEVFLRKALPSPNANSPAQTILELKGTKWTVVNLWATWCTPCREEMPEFVAFRNEFGATRGIEFVGVAIDRPEPVKQFLKEKSIDYPILIDEISAIEVTKAFGNSRMALPFSYILDANGRVVQTKLGKLTRDELLEISSK